jgi:RNA polymerase sigma factor (sigma-70 family)
MTNFNIETNPTLINRIRDIYDDESWDNFVSSYQRYIQLVLIGCGCNKNEVEDLGQTVLLKIWKSLPTFNYSPENCKFRSWMNTVIRNTYNSYLKKIINNDKKIKAYSSEPVTVNEAPITEKVYQDAWEDHISKLAFENIKKETSANNIECFLMFLRGVPAEEISEALSLKLNSTYVIKNRVKEKLMKEIKHLERDLS